ncbi:MAG: zinc-binding dehydrogenase, partial [Myxococcales bacterium]|nr:zinc-binding dehydrogenase [Myxococcales bacterium]
HTLRERFDVFFDVYGNQPFPKARAVLSSRGRHVSTVPRPADFVWQARTLVSFPRTRVVVVRPRRADLEQLARWVDEGKLRAVIDSVHSLDQVAEAERRIETKRARGKVVLRVR